MYALIVAAALSLPWSLFGGFIAWLALSALAETTNFDTFLRPLLGSQQRRHYWRTSERLPALFRRQSAQQRIATTVMK